MAREPPGVERVESSVTARSLFWASRGTLVANLSLRSLRNRPGQRSGTTPEAERLGLPSLRDRGPNARSAVHEDRRLAVRDDHTLDRQLRDPLE
jgi:hypothetical protein